MAHLHSPQFISVRLAGGDGQRGVSFVARPPRKTSPSPSSSSSSSCDASNHSLLLRCKARRGENASVRFGEQAGGAHPTSFFHSQACIVHALPLLLLPLLLLSFAPVVSALINIRFMTPKTPFLGRQPDTRPGKKGGERKRAEQKAIGLLVGNTVELSLKLPSIGGLQDCNRR